ncbi:MAG TPA: PQQ-binding-like beta-propeller repeat protein, partial [Pseudothermotoga sp.]
MSGCPAPLTNNPPSKPNLLSPTNNATGVSVTPTLSWTCSDPDGDNLVYDVYLDKNSNPQTSIVSNHSSTTYTLTTALEYNTTYYWKVVAKDGKGGTNTSDVYSFTTLTLNNPPSKPNLLSPANNATGVSVTPTLSWTCSDPDGDNLVYDVYLDKNSNPQTSIVSNHSSTTYTLTTALEYNTTYYWKVVAKDNKGETNTSDVYSFTTINVTGSLSIYKKYQLVVDGASGPVYSSPAMGPDGKIYIGSQGGYVVISPITYLIEDAVTSYYPIWASPVVDYANNKVYFADNEGCLYVYPDKLSYNISNYSIYSIYAAPVIIGDYVYVVDLSGQVIKVSKSNPSNYTIIRNLNKEVRSSPVVVSGKLFVATVDGYIYAIDPSNGAIAWQKGFSDEFLGGFAVDLNKNLYIAGEKLWCINLASGNVIWSYDLSGQVYGSPVISENGTVYV